MNTDIQHAYNDAAEAYRKKYDNIPQRVADVDLGLSYVSKENPFVLEIGCAYGREAAYIVTKTDQYVGIDISENFIKQAQSEISTGEFVCADVTDFEFPDGLDIVFAFASLLHLSKEELQQVLQRLSEKVASGGVVFLSLKRRDAYQTEVEDDGITVRRFYYYTREVITDICPPSLQEVHYDEQFVNGPWFNLILQKV